MQLDFESSSEALQLTVLCDFVLNFNEPVLNVALTDP